MNELKNMIPVKGKDAKELSDTIVEVEACRELYEQALTQPVYSSQALTDVLNRFMQALKVHKALWRELLLKYAGEENALYYRDLYRYDTMKKVIFLQETGEVEHELA
jgi:hypothetical protein